MFLFFKKEILSFFVSVSVLYAGWYNSPIEARRPSRRQGLKRRADGHCVAADVFDRKGQAERYTLLQSVLSPP